ncbi:MAG: hypothetical protein F7C34_05610 [Desulfurococcales archaeon]|nr:hypothetical protein [Desulfurococcales archaeon]
MSMLRGAELQAAVFIKQYINESKKRCFTYRGLRAWWSRNRKYQGSEWHTVERAVRKLAESGYLRRVRRGRRVVFCPTARLRFEWNELEKIVVRGYRHG